MAIGEQPGRLKCSPLTYFTINNWVHEPSTCSSTATGLEGILTRPGWWWLNSFSALAIKMYLESYAAWLGCQEVPPRQCDGLEQVLRKVTQRHRLVARARLSAASLGTQPARTSSSKSTRDCFYLDKIFPPFCPQESKTGPMEISIACDAQWFSTPTHWTQEFDLRVSTWWGAGRVIMSRIDWGPVELRCRC